MSPPTDHPTQANRPTPQPPRPRRLVPIGVLTLATVATVVAFGLIDRARARQELVQWTDAQAIPTVALAPLAGGRSEEPLILPGNIQPHKKAAIYARVSGYLKSWDA